MKIIIVDDDVIVSSSLKTILEATNEVEILGIGQNGNDAVTLYQTYKPDIALLDIQMPEKNGLEAGKGILEIDPDAKILYLTTFSDNDYIIQALRLGAKGYILKQEFTAIATALKAVANGQSVFGTDIVSKLPTLLQNNNPFSYRDLDINEKEEEIIVLVAQGLNNKEIADQLFLSEGTVRNYLSNILDKLNLRDRTQLAVFYYKNVN
ncbi:MAG: response regulator transcription factor [Lachnospiraceae bacterium]|nr:response regulator transcription factor [Lachnospiraceae bacterium]